MNLTKAKLLMAERDSQGGDWPKPLAECMDTYLGLADEVPGLVEEIERLRGPLTCQHEPEHAGGACAVCHAEAVEALEYISELGPKEFAARGVYAITNAVEMAKRFIRRTRGESCTCPDTKLKGGEKAVCPSCLEKRAARKKAPLTAMQIADLKGQVERLEGELAEALECSTGWNEKESEASEKLEAAERQVEASRSLISEIRKHATEVTVLSSDMIRGTIDRALREMPGHCVRCGKPKPCPEHFKGM